MLEIRDISYQRAGQPILSGITLQIPASTMVGIIGSNAAGKSTLAKLSVGLLNPTAGQVLLDNVPYTTMSRHERCKRVSLVFQDPETQSVSTTVEEELAFGPENLGFPRERIRERVEHSLQTMGLEALRTRDMHKLSGGQKQRVAIAACLAIQPQVLVLDEPTAMLDPTARERLLQHLSAARNTAQLSTLYITHRLEELKEANQIYLLHEGKLECLGDYHNLTAHRALLLRHGVKIPSELEVPYRMRQLGFELELSGLAQAASFLISQSGSTPTPQSASSCPLLHLEHFSQTPSKSSASHFTDLTDLTLAIEEGESIGLTGPTGSGKSTLLAHLNGLKVSSLGRYRFQGEAINPSFQRFRWLRQQVGLLFQNPEHFFSHESVELELDFGITNFDIVSDDQPRSVHLDQICQALESVGLDPKLLSKAPTELSGGQQRLVALAAVLVCKPRVLLLDEPTAGLDASHIQKVKLLLKEYQGAKIIVSHDLEELSEMADRVLLLKAGKIIKDGFLRQSPSEWAGLGLTLPPIPQALAEAWKTQSLCPFTPDQLALPAQS